MALLRATLRRVIRLSAAKFVVVSGAEKSSDLPVSVLWSGTEQQLAYFQERVFGCNTVAHRKIGRRPMILTNSLMKKFNCSFCVLVVEQHSCRLCEGPVTSYCRFGLAVMSR